MSAEERRIDPADGNAYTIQEFLNEYGNLDKWNAAAPPPPPPSARDPCQLFLAGLCPHSADSCPCGVHATPGRLAPAGAAPAAAPHTQQGAMTEDQAKDIVAALTPAERQAAVLRAGGRQVWTGMSWIERLRVARPGMAPPPSPPAPAPMAPAVALVAGMQNLTLLADEKRIDDADGNAYTQAEFLQEYGTQQGPLKWALARPFGPAPNPLPAPAPAAPPAPARDVYAAGARGGGYSGGGAEWSGGGGGAEWSGGGGGADWSGGGGAHSGAAPAALPVDAPQQDADSYFASSAGWNKPKISKGAQMRYHQHGGGHRAAQRQQAESQWDDLGRQRQQAAPDGGGGGGVVAQLAAGATRLPRGAAGARPLPARWSAR